jgi:hypothetical protein
MARSILSLSFGLALIATLSFGASGCGHGGAGNGVACGKARCAAGDVCCNASCGICTPPGGVCTQQVCTDPGAASCRTDADCRLFSDYCTGCDCRALPTGAPDPTCSGPGVQCLVDPCQQKSAVCKNGACMVAGT